MTDRTHAPRRTTSTPPAATETGWEYAPRRLDPVSARWVRTYRALSAVRPNLTARVLGAEVEAELSGAAA